MSHKGHQDGSATKRTRKTNVGLEQALRCFNRFFDCADLAVQLFFVHLLQDDADLRSW